LFGGQRVYDHLEFVRLLFAHHLSSIGKFTNRLPAMHAFVTGIAQCYTVAHLAPKGQRTTVFIARMMHL
jgi:hypothetical protein